MIYIITFLLSLLFIYLSIKTYHKNKIVSKIFEIFGILLPCLLAALRDYSIGTDVEVYVEPLFKVSLQFDSFFSFYAYAVNAVKDFLYLLTTFACSHISNNIGFLFFVLELLVILPIYIALKKRFNKSNCVLLGMLLFYLFFYNQSFNMARQSISISFIILGLSFLDENKSKSFLFCFLIACLFHNTAIVFFAIFLLYKIISSKKINKKIKFLIEITIVIIAISGIFFLPQYIKFAENIGLVNLIKYDTYINKYLRENIDISFIHSTIYLFVCLVLLKYNKRIKENEKNASYYLFTSILSFIFLQFGSIISYAERIGYYVFYPILITIVPYIIFNKNSKLLKDDFYVLCITILIFFTYWIVWICLLNYNGTFPYVFR